MNRISKLSLMAVLAISSSSVFAAGTVAEAVRPRGGGPATEFARPLTVEQQVGRAAAPGAATTVAPRAGAAGKAFSEITVAPTAVVRPTVVGNPTVEGPSCGGAVSPAGVAAGTDATAAEITTLMDEGYLSAIRTKDGCTERLEDQTPEIKGKMINIARKARQNCGNGKPSNDSARSSCVIAGAAQLGVPADKIKWVASHCAWTPELVN